MKNRDFRIALQGWVSAGVIFSPLLLMSLPTEPNVVAGSASCVAEVSSSLEITTSEKAILEFKSFDVGRGEQVRFIQPSPQSCVLSRVTGKDPSQILGSIEANGRLFLVNPEGIYFGPDARIHAHALVASVLDISNEDFLQERYAFHLRGSSTASLIQEGMLSAESSVALLGPVVENRGRVRAERGQVAMGAAERVTLDFTGDRLLQFVVEGELEKALIYNEGVISARQGSVDLTLRAARRVVQSVVNVEGVKVGVALVESQGKIRLASQSEISSKAVRTDGDGKVEVSGKIEGKSVQLLGDEIALKGARVEALNGEVRVGGDLQGVGELRRAVVTSMDSDSKIVVDATNGSEGGRVSLWADREMLFNGKIYARGGVHEGAGGFVDTSSGHALQVATGLVDTSSSRGKLGQWVLHAPSIAIEKGGAGKGVASIAIGSALSHVIVSGQGEGESSIVVADPISMSMAGAALSFKGSVALSASILTKGAPIDVQGDLVLRGPVHLDTTHRSPAGGDVSCRGSINGLYPLTVTGGVEGEIFFKEAVGGVRPLASLQASGRKVMQLSTVNTVGAIDYRGVIALSGDQCTESGPIGWRGDVTLHRGVKADTTQGGRFTKGAELFVAGLIDGAHPLTLVGGSDGAVTLERAIGEREPLASLDVTGGLITQNSTVQTTGAIEYTGLIVMAGNQTTSGGKIEWNGAVGLGREVRVDTTGGGTVPKGASVRALKTIGGAYPLTCIAGSEGIVTWCGAVGNETRLESLTVQGASIVQGSSVATRGPIQYRGAISIGGDQNTVGGEIRWDGAVMLHGDAKVDTTSGGALPQGASMIASSSMDGAYAFAWIGGSDGVLTLDGAVGGSEPLASFTFKGAALVQHSTLETKGGIDCIGGLSVAGNQTTAGAPIGWRGAARLRGDVVLDTTCRGLVSKGASIVSSSSIDGPHVLKCLGGTQGAVELQGTVGRESPLASMTVSGATIRQCSSVEATGAIEYAGAIHLGGNQKTAGGKIRWDGPVLLEGDVIGEMKEGALFASSSIDGEHSLVVNACGGWVEWAGAVGEKQPLSSLTVTSGTIRQGSTVKTTGAIFYEGVATVGGDQTTEGGAIEWRGNAFLGRDVVLDTTNRGLVKSGAPIEIRAFVNGEAPGKQWQLIGETVWIAENIGNGVPLANFSIQNASTCTLRGKIELEGSFTQLGKGATHLSGSIHGKGPIQWEGPLFVQEPSTLHTESHLLFSSEVEGPGDLSLVAEKGEVSFKKGIGASIPVGVLCIQEGKRLSFSNATAHSIFVKEGGAVLLEGNVVALEGGISFGSEALLMAPLSIEAKKGEVSFLNTVDGEASLSVRAKSLLFGNAVGGQTPLTSVSIFNQESWTLAPNGSMTLKGPLIQKGAGTSLILGPVKSGGEFSLGGAAILATSIEAAGAVTFQSPVTVSGASSISNGTTNQEIAFLSTVDGPGSLTLNAGAGTIRLIGSVGGGAPLQRLTWNTTGAVFFNDIKVEAASWSGHLHGASISAPFPVMLTGDCAIDARGDVHFYHTLDGPYNMSIKTGEGALFFDGAVGSSVPLNTFFFEGAKMRQNSTLETKGAIECVGELFMGGNQTTAGAPVVWRGEVQLYRDLVVDTTCQGLHSPGASILASHSIDGAYTLQLFGGSHGRVALQSGVGLKQPLYVLTAMGEAVTQHSSVEAVGAIDYSGAISLAGNQTTAGGVIRWVGPVTLEVDVVADTTKGGRMPGGAPLFVSGSIDGSHHLVLNGGDYGFVEWTGAVGETKALSSFTVKGNMLKQGSTVKTTGAILYQGAAILGGDQTTAGGAIEWQGATSLRRDVELDTTNRGLVSKGAPIEIHTSINGESPGKTLKLLAGEAGTVSISGNIGDGVPLEDLSIQVSSTCTVEGKIHLEGSFTQTGQGSVYLSEPIQSDGSIQFEGPLFLRGPSSLLHTGSNLLFSQVVEGPGDLTLVAEAGIEFKKAVGASIPLGVLKMRGGQTLSLGNVSAQSIFLEGNGEVLIGGVLKASEGGFSCKNPTLLTGPLSIESMQGEVAFLSTVDGKERVSISGRSVRFGGAVGEKRPLESLSISNHELWTLTTGSSLKLTGPLLLEGEGLSTLFGPLTSGAPLSFQGPVLLAASIETTGGVCFQAPVTLGGATSISNGTTHQEIAFLSPVEGPGSLTVDAGAGTIRFASSIGGAIPLKELRLDTTGSVFVHEMQAGAAYWKGQFHGAALAAPFPVTLLGDLSIDVSGEVHFHNTVDGPYNLSIKAGGADLFLDGSIGRTVPMRAITLEGVRNVHLGGSIFANSLVELGSGGTATLRGDIYVTGATGISFASPVVLEKTALWNTEAGNGSIRLPSLDGSGGLTLATGSGDIFLNGALGSATCLGDLVVSSCHSFKSGSIHANSLWIEERGGSVLIQGDLFTEGNRGVQIHATRLLRPGEFHVSNGGPLRIVCREAYKGSESHPIRAGMISMSSTGKGGLSLGETIVAEQGGIEFLSPVTLLGSTCLDSSQAGGSIHFAHSLNGAQDLYLSAGAGKIVFDEAVGNGVPIGVLTIHSAGDVQAEMVAAASIFQATGKGTTIFRGPIHTTRRGGISLCGNQFAFHDGVMVREQGFLEICHTGLLTIENALLNIEGGFREMGGGAVSLGADLISKNGAIHFGGAVTLCRDLVLDGRGVHFASTVDGAYSLQVAGDAAVRFVGAIGACMPLYDLSVKAAAISQQKALTATRGVEYTGKIFLGGDITTVHHPIALSGDVRIGNSLILSTGFGDGDIKIQGTLNGRSPGLDLTLTAGEGSIRIEKGIGEEIRFNDLTLRGETIAWNDVGSAEAPGVTGLTTIQAGRSITFEGSRYNQGAQWYEAKERCLFVAAAPTRVISCNNPITFKASALHLLDNGSLRIDSYGGDITLPHITADSKKASLSIDANMGSIGYVAVGTQEVPLDRVDLTAAKWIDVAAPIHSRATTLNSTERLYLSQDVIGAPGSAIVYNAPVVIGADVVIFSKGAPITFNQTVDADSSSQVRSLTLMMEGGAVRFNAPVGAMAELASLSVVEATDVTLGSRIRVGSFHQRGGKGTASLLSLLETTGVDGVSFASPLLVLRGAAVVKRGGMTLQHSLGLTMEGAYQVAGDFSQTGEGAVFTSGWIEVEGAASFGSDLTLTRDWTFHTSQGSASFGAIDGAHLLTIEAERGSLTFRKEVGKHQPLKGLVVESAMDVSGTSLFAGSWTQKEGAGKTRFTGLVSTTGMDGISLAGNQISLLGGVRTEGPLLISHQGVLSLEGTGVIGGVLTESGTGPVRLGGTWQSRRDVLFVSPIELTQSTEIDTSLKGASISFRGSLNGTESLTLSGGTIHLDGRVGGEKPLGQITILGVKDIRAPWVHCAAWVQFNGTGETKIGHLETSSTVGVLLKGHQISLSGDLRSMGPVKIVNRGPLLLEMGSATRLAGGFTQEGSGVVFLSGALVAPYHPISFEGPVVIKAPTSISNAPGSSRITFSSSLDGPSDLTLKLGVGELRFGGAVGKRNRLHTMDVKGRGEVVYRNEK